MINIKRTDPFDEHEQQEHNKYLSVADLWSQSFTVSPYFKAFINLLYYSVRSLNNKKQKSW